MPPLKIATWNLERPKIPRHGDANYRNDRIIEVIRKIDADILVLTETNSILVPALGYASCVSSDPLPVNELCDGIMYHEGENRTTILSRFPLKKKIDTADNITQVCADFDTPYGDIRVYGTIIGIRGRQKPWFGQDLENVVNDCAALSGNGHFILAGDLNLSFSDSYYPNQAAKQRLEKAFEENNLVIQTSEIPETIDHIIVSKSLLKNNSIPIINSMMARDKTLSDHKWVSVVV
jgi:endonuclease/exonuclease/phosphatase family metal-dependent hydrolase